MRKEDIKHFSLKRFLILGAISFTLPAFTAVPVAAETANTITLEDIEQKRKDLEQAQKEYDMALAGQHAAEDLVENARRARDDAQEQYDIIMEKYKKGFAGFLQWVIDSEDDPLRIEDAKSTLALLQERGETDDISPSSPRNITRMFYTAQWLDEYADFFDQFEARGLTAGTSHYIICWAQNMNKPADPYSIFANLPIHAEVRYLGTFAENNDGIPVWKQPQDDKWIKGSSIISETSYYDENIPENIPDVCIGFSSFVNPDSGENMSLDIVIKGYGCYTLREYAQALRDYYALVDPLPSKTALNGFDDDFTNAKKELKDVEDIVSSKYARLKKAQKDYEEAVALLTVNTALPEEAAAGSEILPTSAATDGMPMYTGEEFNETYSTATDNNSLSETTSDTDDKKHNVIADNASASVTEKANTPPVTTAIDLSYVDAVNEDDNTNKNSVKQNGILLQVLSYIFNGGAIAVIIPTGFRRRKKSIEEEIIPNKKAPGKAL